MARIPDDHIERIKREVSLLTLVESQGYQLQKQGKDYAVCCPFHDDKTPSCIISPKSNLFNCFGCGAGGSVIDWVMKTQGVGFRHAVEILREGNPSVLAATAAHTSPVKKATVPKLDAPISNDVDDQKMLQQVISYYHDTLKQSPEALAYLQQRGLDDPELINHFKLGYANRTLGLRLPQKNRQAGKAMREQLQRIGLYRETGREHFNGSIVFPVMDENEIIGEVYGRKIRDDLRKGTPKHTYLPNEHSGVFNIQGIMNASVASGVLPPATLEHPCSSEIILCECIIDALTFWRWGFRHVTCSYGTNGFTDEVLQALINNKVKRVLIAYDRDEAGNTAAEKLAPILLENGIDTFRILLPKNMDVNSYACQVQPPQKTLALVIRKAEWLGNGKAPERQLELTEIHTAPTAETEQVIIAEPITKESPQTEINIIDKQASPLPPLAASVDVKATGTETLITLGDRVYRVRGLKNNNHLDQLKINLMVKRDEQFHLDKLDLYSSKQRQVFINQSCVELGVKDEVIKKDLGKVLLALEEQQAQQQEDSNEKATVEIDSESRKVAMELLHDPLLLDRVLSDFKCAGVVGEETNKLAGYLSCVSRKLDKPLAVIIQSSSVQVRVV